MLLHGVTHTDMSHVGPHSMCWAHNWLLSFNLFMSIYSLKLICFNSRAMDELTWSTLLPRKLFSLSMVINNLHDVVLGMRHANGGRILKLVRKGTLGKGRRLGAERGQHGAEADNSGLVQNCAWERSYLSLAGGAVGFLCEIRSERCFPLVVRLPPPSRQFPAQ